MREHAEPNDFLDRAIGQTFSHANAVHTKLASGALAVRWRSRISTAYLADLYTVRAKLLDGFDTEYARRHRRDMVLLAAGLRAARVRSCDMWTLAGANDEYLLFADARNDTVFGCLRVYDPCALTRAARREIWGERLDQPRERFRHVCWRASDVDHAQADLREIEPYLVRLLVLAYALEDDGARDQAVDAFSDVLHGRIDAPFETLAFCMRELRYPEVLVAARDWAGWPTHAHRTAFMTDLERAYARYDGTPDSRWAYYSAPEESAETRREVDATGLPMPRLGRTYFLARAGDHLRAAFVRRADGSARLRWHDGTVTAYQGDLHAWRRGLATLGRLGYSLASPST